MKEEIKNTKDSHNMFGDLKTQKWAQEALPKLVQLAHEQKTINLKEMAESWHNVKAYRLMGIVGGVISSTLYELERQPDWKFGEIPRIDLNMIRTNGEPTTWVCEQITGDRKIVPPWEFYYKYHLLSIYEYPHWNEVLEALSFPLSNDVEQQLRESDLINWDPQQLLSDFLSAAEHGQIEISPDTISIEQQPKPHTPPKELPEGKIAVYVFSTDTEVLKVGKVNPGSKDRYCSHHYTPQGANSTLAKSLIDDENSPVIFRADKKTISVWIKENTDRVNYLLDAELGPFVLNLFEAYIQCRLTPKYEGSKSQG